MKKEDGFTLIELIFSILLAALFIPALAFVFSFSLNSADQGENYTKAYTIAQQNMEAIYYLKENNTSWDWVNNPQNNSSNDYYQPQQSTSGAWVLGSVVDEGNLVSVDGYTASVQILAVYRDSEDRKIVEEGGEENTASRKIIVKVSWKENGVPTSIDLVSYVTNH